MDKDIPFRWIAAGLATLLVLGVLAFQFVLSGRSLERQGVERIERWLRYEPNRASVGEVIDVVSGGWTDRPAIPRDRAAQAPPFEIVSVERHGWHEDFVVRVRLRYPQGAPPGTPTVRYFRMRYSPALNSWKVVSETSALSYYLAILP